MPGSQKYKSTFPNPKAIELARSLARIALQDAVGAKQMYHLRNYALAVYLLQQSVEKSTKATGLLTACLQPTQSDLLKVGHRSVLGILLRMPKKVETAKVMLDEFRDSGAFEEYESLGLKSLLPDLDRFAIPESATVEGWIRELRLLPPADLWRRTLELKQEDSLTIEVMRGLTKVDESAKAANLLDEIIFRSFPFLSDIGFILYACDIQLRCLPCALILSMVTMWHETTTRYPPGETSDYWTPEAYTLDKGLVKQFTLFQEHASDLARWARWASSATSIAEFPE
jgi:hypothetical protein